VYNPATPLDIRVEFLAQSNDVADTVNLALLAAVHPITAPAHPALTRLRESATLAVAQRADVPWPDKPRSVYDLPNRTALPWTDIDPRILALEGTTLTVRGVELTVTALRSRHALHLNATYMGNCTESYAPQISSGDTAMLALRDASGTTVYNVELNQRDDHWTLGQVNTRHNAGVSPEEAEALRAVVPQ
jgi:hypothetical protein